MRVLGVMNSLVDDHEEFLKCLVLLLESRKEGADPQRLLPIDPGFCRACREAEERSLPFHFLVTKSLLVAPWFDT